jgi:AcrR family transcriptional regulator
METATPSAEAALVHAAIELFGQEGYAAVSTRTLCDRAGTNLSSIKYHFGGKDELYEAAVKHVIDQLSPRIEMAIAAFNQGRELAGEDPGRQALLLKQIVANLLQLFLRSDDIPHFMPFVMREFFLPGPYFPRFYDALPRRLHEMFTAMVAMVDGADPEAESTIIRAHSLIGQIMIFHVGRPILFNRLGWTSYSPEAVSEITDHVQSLLLNALGLGDHQADRSHV